MERKEAARRLIFKIIDYCATTPKSPYNNIKTSIFDLIEVIRDVATFKTIKELIFEILNTIPKGCDRVDALADTYRTVFFKK